MIEVRIDFTLKSPCGTFGITLFGKEAYQQELRLAAASWSFVNSLTDVIAAYAQPDWWEVGCATVMMRSQHKTYTIFTDHVSIKNLNYRRSLALFKLGNWPKYFITQVF